MGQLWSHPRFVDLAVYLIPQALPLSIPVGLMFGILWALGRVPVSRTVLVLVLLLALGGSLVSFATLAWVMPNANQAFRAAAAGGPVARGANELTIGELRRRIQTARTLSPASLPGPNLALNYHRRWALGLTPFVLAVFGIIFTRARTCGRVMPFVLGPIVIFGYYFIMYAARELGADRAISPFAAAWAPNAVLLMVSAAVLSFQLPRRKRNAPGSR
jgi:lipopolysaccharide export LptBFGC system permease protein LptF